MKPTPTRRTRRAAVIVVSLACVCPVARAGNTWDGGGGDDNWSTAANWDGDTAPGFGTLTFSGSTRTSNIMDANTSMNMLLWTGASDWTLNNASGYVLSLYDYNNGSYREQAKLENQSTGLVTINAPVNFAATEGPAWGEINAVNGDITFSSSGTIASSGSVVSKLQFYGLGHTVTINSANSGLTEEIDIHTGNVAVGTATSIGNGTVYVGNGGTDFDEKNAGLLINAGGVTLSNQIVTNKADTGSGIGTGTRTIGGTNTSGTATYSGNIYLNGGAVLTAASGGTVAFSGPIADGSDTGNVSRSITKTGAGTVTLSGSNSYTGTTFISSGTLSVTGTGVVGGATGSTGDASNIVFTGASGNPTLQFETAAQLGNADQIRFRTTGGTAGRLDYVGTTTVTVNKAIQCDTSLGLRLDSDSVGGSVTYSGSFANVAGNRPIYLGGTGTGANTVSSAITANGSGTLTKDGTGTWVLSGANTYSGGTTILDGTLKFGNGLPIGKNSSWSKGFTLRNGTVDINGQNNYTTGNLGPVGKTFLIANEAITLGGQAGGVMTIQDTGASPNGFGLFNLQDCITYDATNNPGTATISAPWLGVGTSSATTKTITVGDSTATTVELDFTGTLSQNTGNDGSQTTIQKAGAGTMRISAANYFPYLQISAGKLIVNHANALGTTRTQNGTANNLVTVNGGTLDLNGFSPSIGGLSDGSVTTGVILNDGAAASTLTVGSSNASTTYGGTIVDGTSTVALTKTGAGSLGLANNANSFTGDVTISGGTVTATGGVASGSTNSSLGQKSSSRTINVNSGGTLWLTAKTGSSNTFGGSGMTVDQIPTLVIDGGSVYTGKFNTLGNITLRNGGALINSSQESGGTYQAYQFIGDITVDGTGAGVTMSNDGNHANATGNHLKGGGTTTFTVGDITGNSDADLTISSALHNGSGDYGGTAALVKAGAGTMVLSGNNTYKGSTTINGGTLKIADGGGLYRGDYSGDNLAVTVNSGGTLELYDWGYNISTASLGGLSANAGRMVVDGGTIRMNNGSTETSYSRGVTVKAGGATLEANGTAAWTIDTTGNAWVFNDNPNLTLTGTGVGEFQKAINSGSGGLTKSGTGTWTLSGANTFTGNVAVNAGILKFGIVGPGNGTGGGPLGRANTDVTKCVVASGTTLDINGFDDTNYGITIAGTGTAGQGALINNGGPTANSKIQTPNIKLSANASIGGTGNFYMIASGYGGTTLDLNSNTLTKVGSNTFYLANTTVTAGTVQVSGGKLSQSLASNGSAAAFVLDNTSGVALDLNNQAFSAGSLAGGGEAGGNVDLGSATLTVGALNTSTTYAGGISGTGALTKTGTGTQALSGANTYTGTTYVNQGTLALTGSGVLGGASGSTTDAGNIVFSSSNSDATLSFETAAQLGAASQIRFRNTGGTIGQGGRLLYVGTTDQVVTQDIQCDTSIGLRFASDSTTGSVTYSGTWDNVSSARPIYLEGTGTGDNTISGAMNGSTLTKSGTGTWILSGANTYTGATTVSAGTLVVAGSTSSSSAVTVAAGTVANTPVAKLGGTGIIGGNVSLTAESTTGHKNGGVLAPTAAASGTKLSVTGTTTFGSGSIFEWNMSATTPTTDPGVVSNYGSYGQLAGTGTIGGSGAIFNIVLGSGNAFTDAFWNSDKSWTNILTGAGTTNTLASIFSSISGADITFANNKGTVANQGYFTFNGASTLNWTAIPELSNLLIGALLGAGMMRRKRKDV